jgi:hypothetical protein
MERLKKEELTAIMQEWEREHGEDCIEYVGYGYGKVFSEWLLAAGYAFTGSICVDTLEELSDNIIAYFDVIAAFTDDSDNEALDERLRWEVLPDYLTNYASDEEYINAVTHFTS